MKTKEELNAPKEEAEALSKKLQELKIEELEQVTGSGRRRVEFVFSCPLCGHAG